MRTNAMPTGQLNLGALHNDYYSSSTKYTNTTENRYASCGVALFLLIVLACAAAWSRLKQPRTSIRACWTIALMTTLTASYL